MGLFDGVLIASDWDGTLFYKNTVPEKTQSAINYFMAEGGRFAITSGRAPDYLLENQHLIKPNTYCICFGGTLICDVESGEILRKGALDDGVFEAVDEILASGLNVVKINVFGIDGIKQYTLDEYAEFGKKEALATEKYKITINCADAAEGNKLRAFCETLNYPQYTFARSFATYLEIMQTEYTKGISANILKEKLAARVLVGMGDYENDIPLFGKCDVSFAVANAKDCLKNIATYTTKSAVWESAAAEVIESLEKLILAGKI
jgi:Cof subfamily protein (haloacid dehalogenase superfamily)